MLDFNEGCQIGATPLSIMTPGISTLSKIAHIIMTLGIRTPGISTLSKIAHIILTLSLRTLQKHVEYNGI